MERTIERATEKQIETLRAMAYPIMDLPPDQLLEDGERGTYLRRWYATPKVPFGGVYVHHIMRSDKDVPHDHPWDFVSVIIRGDYQEFIPGEGLFNRPLGSILRRRATDAHRIVMRPGEQAVSVVFVGPRIRDWGFLCPKGWVNWKDFTDPADEGIVGRGCGEYA